MPRALLILGLGCFLLMGGCTQHRYHGYDEYDTYRQHRTPPPHRADAPRPHKDNAYHNSDNRPARDTQHKYQKPPRETQNKYQKPARETRTQDGRTREVRPQQERRHRQAN